MAEPAARKELRLKLTLEQDLGRGSQALQQLARDAERLAAAAGRANRELRGDPAAGGGRAAADGRANRERRGDPAAGGGRAAADGGGGPGVRDALFRGAAVTASLAATAATVAGLVKATQGLDNPMTTAREKVLGFAQAVPLVGGALASLTGSLLDMAFRLQNPELARAADVARLRHPVDTQRAAFQFAGEQRITAAALAAGEAANRARVLEANPAFTAQLRGLGGAFGVAAPEAIDPRLAGPMAAARQAEREVLAAAGDSKAANDRVARLDAEARAALRDLEALEGVTARRAAEAGVGPGGGRRDVRTPEAQADAAYRANREAFGAVLGRVLGAGAYLTTRVAPRAAEDLGKGLLAAGRQTPYEMALLAEQEKYQVYAEKIRQLEEATNRQREKAAAYEQKKFEYLTKQTETMRTRLALLDEEAAKSRAAAQQFGSLDEVSQRGVYDAFQRYRQGGRDWVTEGEFQRLQSLQLTAGFVGKKTEEDTLRNNQTYKLLLQQTGQRDLEVIARERLKLKTEIDVKVEADEQQLARAIDLGMRSFQQHIENYVREQIRKGVQNIEAGAALGRVQRAQ